MPPLSTQPEECKGDDRHIFPRIIIQGEPQVAANDSVSDNEQEAAGSYAARLAKRDIKMRPTSHSTQESDEQEAETKDLALKEAARKAETENKAEQQAKPKRAEEVAKKEEGDHKKEQAQKVQEQAAKKVAEPKATQLAEESEKT